MPKKNRNIREETGKQDSYDISTIFDQYKKKMFGLALSITRNVDDAQDVMQNAFIKIMKNIKRFEKRSRISTWIYRITYNEGLMMIRKKRRNFKLANTAGSYPKESVSGLFVNWPKLPDEALLEGEFKQRVEGIIERMPIQYRMVLLLHRVEGLSVKETACVLSLKEGSVKTRLHRSYMMLREGVRAYFKDTKEKAAPSHRCNLVLDFLYHYADGSLNKAARARFERHINDCAGCKEFLGSYQDAIRITHTLQCYDIPPELHKRIEKFLVSCDSN